MTASTTMPMTTISGGDWLCDQDAVEAFVNEAPDQLLQLEHWGCPWSREPDGSVAVRPFGGMKIQRTWFAADKTGFHMLHALFQTTLKYEGIQRFDEYFVTKLLVDEGRCQGAVAVELTSGRIVAVGAKAVILATGGAGKIFFFTTNANIKNGDGMALAYREGVPLKDMEFVQYHPTGLPFTGILITEASRAEGGWMLNKDGLPLPPGLRPGETQAQASPSFDGARSAGPSLTGFHEGTGKRPHTGRALRPLRSPGPSTPG